MTIRKNQYTASQIPTIPQPKKESSENPLASFFRKSKFTLKLPSKGMWYPKNSLSLDAGGVPVYAMNAADDIKFRTGDATMTGKNIYEVIQSCIPSISDPKMIPHIDLDSLFLAIRLASYGDEFEFVVDVPNTKLNRKINLKASSRLQELASRNNIWDDELEIVDESGKILRLNIHPIPLHKIFSTSKVLHTQKYNLNKNLDADQNIRDEAAYTSSMSAMTDSALDLLCSSIHQMELIDSTGAIMLSLASDAPQDSAEIVKLIRNMDIEYFNAIRDHINAQRSKFIFTSPMQYSTEEERKAGAPEQWVAELSFVGSNFLPEQKNTTGIM